jgi:hypothetical protein
MGLLIRKTTSSVLPLRQVCQSWITRPALDKLPLEAALYAGLACMKLANLVICATSSCYWYHQARSSTAYALQLEKIHCRMKVLTYQSFPYSRSHPKFVLVYSFYPRQNIGTYTRGHFRGYPNPRKAPPVTTAWFVLRLLVKNSAPDVEGKQSRGADKEFCVEQDMNCVVVLAATAVKIIVFCVWRRVAW